MKIKKLALIVLVCIFLVSLCACSSGAKKVVGTWRGDWISDGEQVSVLLVLAEDGQYTRMVRKNGILTSSTVGTWEYKDGSVHTYVNDEFNTRSQYEYKNGKLNNGTTPDGVVLEYTKQGV